MFFGKKHNPNNCSQVRAVLSEYLDGRLGPAEKASVEEHIEGCQTCRQEVASLRETLALLRNMPVAPVPHSFALTSAQAGQRARAPWWRTPLVWQASAGLATLFLAVLLVGDYFSVLDTTPPLSQPPPATAVAATATAEPTRQPGSRPGIALMPTPVEPDSASGQIVEATPVPADTSADTEKRVSEPVKTLSLVPWEIALGGVVAVLAAIAVYTQRRARAMVGKRRV